MNTEAIKSIDETVLIIREHIKELEEAINKLYAVRLIVEKPT